MTVKKALLAIPALALMLAAAPGARAGVQLVKNGSFELSSFGTLSTELTNGSYIAPGVTPGTSGVTDWVNAGGSTYNIWWNPANATTVDARTEYPSEPQRLDANFTGASPDGGFFMGLDGDSNFNGAFSQTIDGLQAGQNYTLTFYWAAVQLSNRTGATTEQLQVSLGSETHFTEILAIPSQGFSGWRQGAFTFTATGSSEVLSFLSLGTPNGLPPMALLDGVSLVPAPEPGTMSLVVIGAIGVAAVRLRRRVATPKV